MSQPTLSQDTVYISETILDTSVEQSVELDYFLPDYCPNIFKLLKTSVIPVIQSQKTAGNQVALDGVAVVRALYLAENSGRVCCVSQNIPFSKTAELPAECQNPSVFAVPRCYFVSGRAVNQRRLDIRGGISCKVKVCDQKALPVITGGSGGGLQFHPLRLSACGLRKSGSKSFVVNEDLELGSAKPAFGSLLGYSCCAVPSDLKLISNKVICKADLTLHILYQPEEENARPETMEFSVPISQIADLPGVTEEDLCAARFAVSGVSIEPHPDDSGVNRILNCEFTVCLFCTADRNQDFVLADDAYSTQYEAAVTTRPVSVEFLLQDADLTVMTRSTVESGTAVSAVCDAWASFGEAAVQFSEEGTLSLSGNLEVSLLCIGTDGMPFVLDKTIPTELKLLSGLEAEEISFSPCVEVLSCGYAILSETSLEVRAELRVSGPVYEKRRFTAITGAAVNEDSPREKDPLCALRICYAEAGDDVWDIAKSYATSMAAVMEENSLEEERLPARAMLLIPLIDG